MDRSWRERLRPGWSSSFDPRAGGERPLENRYGAPRPAPRSTSILARFPADSAGRIERKCSRYRASGIGAPPLAVRITAKLKRPITDDARGQGPASARPGAGRGLRRRRHGSVSRRLRRWRQRPENQYRITDENAGGERLDHPAASRRRARRTSRTIAAPAPAGTQRKRHRRRRYRLEMAERPALGSYRDGNPGRRSPVPRETQGGHAGGGETWQDCGERNRNVRRHGFRSNARHRRDPCS